MYRIILHSSALTVYSYGVMVALGAGVAILYFLTSVKKAYLPRNLMVNLVVGIILFVLLGARVFYVLMHLPYYVLYPGKIYHLWEGGMVFYGGLFSALAFSFYYIRAHHLSFGRIADCAAPGIAFGISIGRVGCFLNGCCYGIPSRFGFVFPPASPAGDAFPHQTLFPTQLISSLNLFLIGSGLHLFKGKGIASYKLLILFLIFYSVHRFFIEFFRADTHPLAFNLTLFQVIGIIFIGFSIVWWKSKARIS